MGRLSQMAKMGRQALAPVRVIVYLVVVLVHAVTATTVPYSIYKDDVFQDVPICSDMF